MKALVKWIAKKIGLTVCEWNEIDGYVPEIEERKILSHGYSVVIAYWDGEGWVNERNRSGDYYTPTHYMEVPELPKVK